MTEDNDALGGDDVAEAPNEAADSTDVVSEKIPKDILERFEVHSYRNAAVVLSESRKDEFEDLLAALREFRITTEMIRTAGGNESAIPKLVSVSLRPRNWHETTIQGDLLVRLLWKEQTSEKRGKALYEKRERVLTRANYLDGHKVDYVKDKVAFDLEWNSKDQTFDRDLYAFSAFFQCGVIDAGVLLTRSASLNPVFRALGPALRQDGTEDLNPKTGEPRMTYQKYGASTTWMGKLLYRLNAGRNGGCPVLAIGITPACIEDWRE